MSLEGQVITHNQSLKNGAIRVDDTPHAVIFLEGDISNKPEDVGSLVGRRVRFDVVQTANGMVAVNIRLLGRRIFQPSEWLWLLAAPVLVMCGTYTLQLSLNYPLLHAYLASVNFLAFLLSAVIARRGLTYETRPAEVTLFLLALAGGSLSALVASYLIPTKFRSDAGRFALFALLVTQLIFLYRYQPLFFSQTSLEIILLKR